MRRLALMLFVLASPFAALAQTPFASFDRASEAVLNDPHDLAFGPDGRLYVADKFAGEVVVLDPETLEVQERIGAGRLSGIHDISFGPSGRGYAAVTGLGAVVVLGRPEDGYALQNVLQGFPRTEGALAHSNGTLYVMASGAGQLVAVHEGRFAAIASGLWGAHDVAEAQDGSLWVADTNGARLVQFDTSLRQIKVLDGPQFGFIGPRYLDVDDFGRLVVADQDAHRVLLIDPEAETVLGVIGDGSPGLGPNKLDDPEGVAVRGNSYYFSDSDNNRIVKYVVVVN